MFPPLYRWLPLLFIAIFFAGCSAVQVQTALTQAESSAWTAANALETVNTATGGVLTKAAVDYALKSTDNTGDDAVAEAAAAEANQVIAAQAAAHVSPAGNQAIATAVLNDPATIATATSAAQAVISSTQTTAIEMPSTTSVVVGAGQCVELGGGSVSRVSFPVKLANALRPFTVN